VKIDGVLGKVMRKIGPDDTLIVLSDHGMGPFRRAVHLNSWLRHHGYLRLADDSAPAGEELFTDVDWPRTRAYALGFGAVYLNLRGRERDGAVEPGPAAEALAKEIAEKLKGWVDPDTGASVVRTVYPREAIFKGPYAAEAPDLYVGFNAGYRASWQTAIGGAPAALIEDNNRKWAGDHLFDPEIIPGVLFMNRPLAKDDPSLYDIAPTVLRLAGFGDAELAALELDGSSLFEP
jgi:predicted AlkP superfamily phosphohydrolase/phosphomutase